MKKPNYTLPEIAINQIKGIAYITFSGLMFALAGTAVRFISESMPAVSIVFWRNLLSFIMFCFWLFAIKRVHPDRIKTARFNVHFWRSVCTYGALVSYFVAISLIPLSNAVLLQSMSPVFVPILALIVFRRLSDRYVWIGVIIAFVGVYLVVQPAGYSLSIGTVSGLIAGVFGAGAILFIWMMSETENATTQIFWFSLITLILSLIPLPWTWTTPPIEAIVPLIALGIFTTMAQFTLSAGFSLATGDKVATWSYSSVLFAAIIGTLIFEEKIGAIAIMGMIIVVIGAHLSSVKK